MVRCFIGIFIPIEMRKKILQLQNNLKGPDMQCKFVEEENLHISLSFLGEVGEGEVERIGGMLDEVCNKFKKFEVVVSGVRPIPDESYVRVLALDVFDKDKNYILKNIENEIAKKIGGDAKPPHLTLCRVKKIGNKKEFVDSLQKYKMLSFGGFTVEKIQLIKSVLGEAGPKYDVIHESLLT
jgi:2'-5' RNA ligase